MKNIFFFCLLILFTSFLLALSACRPENGPWPDTIVTGTVVDTSMKPIEGATFTLLRREYKYNGLGGTGYNDIEVKNVQTDANGYFKLSFCRNHDRVYIEKVGYAFYIRKNGYAPCFKCPPFDNAIDTFLESDRILKLIRQ